MHIVWAAHGEPLNAALKRWVADRIWPGKQFDFGDASAMGVFDNEKPLGALLWHNYEPDAGVMEFSAAADSRRWLTRPVLKAMFGYAFNGVGCQMVYCRTSAADRQTHLRRIFKAYGFDEIRVPRLYGRDEDGLLFTLTEERWRTNGFHKQEG